MTNTVYFIILYCKLTILSFSVIIKLSINVLNTVVRWLSNFDLCTKRCNVSHVIQYTHNDEPVCLQKRVRCWDYVLDVGRLTHIAWSKYTARGLLPCPCRRIHVRTLHYSMSGPHYTLCCPHREIYYFIRIKLSSFNCCNTVP